MPTAADLGAMQQRLFRGCNDEDCLTANRARRHARDPFVSGKRKHVSVVIIHKLRKAGPHLTRFIVGQPLAVDFHGESRFACCHGRGSSVKRIDRARHMRAAQIAFLRSSRRDAQLSKSTGVSLASALALNSCAFYAGARRSTRLQFPTTQPT